MKNYLILGINLFALSFILLLVSCEQVTSTAASIKTVIVHDTVDNTLTAAEMQAVMNIRNGKTSAHLCGATTKSGNPCHRTVKQAGQHCFQHDTIASTSASTQCKGITKKGEQCKNRTKNDYCHLHSK